MEIFDLFVFYFVGEDEDEIELIVKEIDFVIVVCIKELSFWLDFSIDDVEYFWICLSGFNNWIYFWVYFMMNVIENVDRMSCGGILSIIE